MLFREILSEKGGVFHRSAGALGCHTRIRAGFPRERWIDEGAFFIVARGPVPRDRWVGEGIVFFRSAGACLPRSQHGEGQALALR